MPTVSLETIKNAREKFAYSQKRVSSCTQLFIEDSSGQIETSSRLNLALLLLCKLFVKLTNWNWSIPPRRKTSLFIFKVAFDRWNTTQVDGNKSQLEGLFLVHLKQSTNIRTLVLLPWGAWFSHDDVGLATGAHVFVPHNTLEPLLTC